MNDLDALSVRDLKILVALAETRHFGRAAVQCKISQPGLSAAVKKIEMLVSAKLFERTSRSCVLTAEGRRVVDGARQALQALRSLAGHSSASAPLEGEFRLGFIPTVGPYYIPQIVRPLLKQFPRLQLVFTEAPTAQLLSLLSERALDGAIIASVPTQTGFLHSALFHEELMLAVPADHPLAAHASARADRLEEREMLFMDEAHCLRNQALESCGRSGRESMTIHATSLQTLLMMVQAGAGIAIVPSMAGEARPRLPRVKFLPFRKPVPTRQIVFAARAESVRGADCEALVAFLKGQERGHQSGAARRSRGI